VPEAIFTFLGTKLLYFVKIPASLTIGPKMVQKKMMNNKACQISKEKNDKASRCCWSAYQKKRLGEMG